MTLPPPPEPEDERAPNRARPKNPEGRRALGEVLRAFRLQKRWSMQRLALEAGYDDAYVWQVEQGRRWPTMEAIWYLLHALGVRWDEFGAALDRRPELQAEPQPRRPM